MNSVLDGVLRDIRDLKQLVSRLKAVETPAANRGTWANRPTSNLFNGQIYTATDRGDQGVEYQYKSSISKWVTTQEYGLSIPINRLMPFLTTAGSALDQAVGWEVFPEYNRSGWGGAYVTELVIGFYTSNAQSGANKLSFRFYGLHTGVANLIPITGTADTSSATVVSNYYQFRLLTAPVAFDPLDHSIQLSFDQVGAAQNCRIYAAISYRIIGA